MPRVIPVPQSRETLSRTAKQIEETAGLFRAIGVQMQDEGFEVLEVANHNQLLLAMEYLDNFAAAARNALRKARSDRGDFRHKNGVPESPKKRTGK
jgi:hypothetical protein